MHRALSGPYLLWTLLSVLYFTVYDLQLSVAFPHPCTDYGKPGTRSAHEGIWGSALHPSQLCGSSLLVNAPRIPAAGVCHQAGTPLVLNPVTLRPPVTLLPNTGLAKALALAAVPFPQSRDVNA